jgi:Tol biopolymer transport system component
MFANRVFDLGINIPMRRFLVLLLCLSAAILSGACNMLSAPPPTETPTPTATITATVTATNTTLPSDIPTDTPTDTPADTSTATITPTPTISLPPTNTPYPAANFLGFDNLEFVSAPRDLVTRLANPYVAYVNFNNRENLSGTPQPVNDVQVLYYAPPGAPNSRVPIVEMTGATGDQIYISPRGDAIAYLRPVGSNRASGLYIIDLVLGIEGRVLPITTLVQRNIFSEPSWSPDGRQLAIVLETGYNLDIFTVERDGRNPTNITNHPSFDFWPSFSPDGRYLMFVSDRLTCPSWTPSDPNTCDGIGIPAPLGGHIFVYDLSARELSQITQQTVSEPPIWLNARQIGFSIGDPTLGDDRRALWTADIVTGQSREIRRGTAGDDLIKLGESWSPGGGAVVFQAANNSGTEIVLMGADGSEVVRTSEFTFSRYGMTAAWSPDGTRIALGGVNGQCPYGAIVLDSAFSIIGRYNAPPSMCEPSFSPDGRFLAFSGVNPRLDGRVDVYVANTNGAGAASMTGALRGQIRLIGWVGGQ